MGSMHLVSIFRLECISMVYNYAYRYLQGIAKNALLHIVGGQGNSPTAQRSGRSVDR